MTILVASVGEERKTVIGYEWLYEVSNLWRIKALGKRVRCRWWYRYRVEHIMKPRINRWWYAQVWLYNKGKVSTISIHKLVIEQYIWRRPSWYEINHIDWKKSNNILTNLEYCTKSENMKHAYKTGLWSSPKAFTWKIGKDHPNSKKVLQINKEWHIISEYRWIAEASRATWICKSCISLCCNNKQKTTWWFIFNFYT